MKQGTGKLAGELDLEAEVELLGETALNATRNNSRRTAWAVPVNDSVTQHRGPSGAVLGGGSRS